MSKEGLDHESETPGDQEIWETDYTGEGDRLDVVLARHFPDISRSRLQKWIALGLVLLDHKPCIKPSVTLVAGQRVTLYPPEPQASEEDWLAEPMSLEVVHEAPEFLIINKPAGLVVHPAAGHASGTLVNGLLHQWPDIAHVARAGIVHRLDRDTTGLMVVAKTPEMHLKLVRQLQDRTVSREYVALAWGEIKGASTISTAIGRDPRDRQKMAVVAPEKGKPAITHIKPIAQGMCRGFPVTLVRCRLETGRTHQIRVHLQHIGHPLVGDPVYCSRAPHASRLNGPVLNRQALHARRLAFNEFEFKAAPPKDFLDLLKASDIDPKLAMKDSR